MPVIGIRLTRFAAFNYTNRPQIPTTKLCEWQGWLDHRSCHLINNHARMGQETGTVFGQFLGVYSAEYIKDDC